jgi:two-component system phosphate regulon sensor histidine kinase PhoR
MWAMGKLISEEGPLLLALGVFFALLASTDMIHAQAALTAFLVTGGLILYRRSRNPRSGDLGPVAVLPAVKAGRDTADAVAILRHMADPLVLLNNSGNVTFYNDAARGLLAEGAQGRHISSVLRVPTILQAVRRTMRTGMGETVEYVQRVPVERHFKTDIVPVELSGQMDVAVLLHLHDITAMKRVEQMRADFVANASHELRTPLASLTGFIETLRGPAQGDSMAQERFLNIMQEQAARMARLIHDLLSLSRIELNEHVPPQARIALTDVLRGVVESMGPMAESLNVKLEFMAGADGLPEVKGDKDELTQVFQNLIDNALKYGAGGGRVQIETGVTLGDDSLPLVYGKIRDFGVGIAEEHLPRLTERFYRVNVTQSRESGGTGLGLAIVKHILNRHKGRLGVESKPGKGSTFTVYLPAAQAETP